MFNLREVLARLLAVPGVRAAVLIGRDGLVIDGAGQGDQHLFDALGALAASALATADALAQELGAGATVSTLLEFESGLVSVDPVGEHAALATYTENGASLGRVRQAIYSLRNEMLRVLDGQ